MNGPLQHRASKIVNLRILEERLYWSVHFRTEDLRRTFLFIPADVRELCSHITIRNNFISNVTNEDWGCVGIGAGYVRNMDISHNEVCHLNYSGICVGWGWTSLESGMCNNRIEANYVHHFARRLYDAGGLYTLSNQPGSVMRNNRIEHLIEAPYATNDRAFLYLSG